MIKFATAVLMSLSSLVATAGDLTTACPASLDRDALTVRGPDGWTGYAPGAMRLSGFGMMAGPPETMSYLVPSSSKTNKAGGSSTWEFEPTWQKWLYCLYDGSAAIQIARRLDDSANICTVTFSRQARGSISSASVQCKANAP